MNIVTRRVLAGATLVLLSAVTLGADYGRTSGAFQVIQGNASYTIPIWTPPGPNGLTPSIFLSYSSEGANSLAGVGWNLSATSSIERCYRNFGQDAAPAGIEMSMNDRYCLDGKRLRLASGTYGGANSVYFTEIADFSRITAFGSSGAGPDHFIVERKDGLRYEYGNTVNARVYPGGVTVPLATTPLRWMLNKVYDRNGNSYVISYLNQAGFAVPDVIAWTPTSQGAGTYAYEAKFNYLSNREDKDSYLGRINGYDTVNRFRLENIQIKSAGVVRRKYRFTYDLSPVTARSRLIAAKECADDAESNCLLPISFSYQTGVEGVTAGSAAPPPGSSWSTKRGRFDFNGDGRNDLVYWNGTSWLVALGANNGFGGPYNSGVTGVAIPERFLASGRDAIATIVGGNLWIYRWDDATSSFTGVNTGVASAAPALAADFDGDGLADLVYFTPNSPTMSVRRNTSAGTANPSFQTTLLSQSLNAGYSWGAVFSYYSTGAPRADFNGDGRQDLYAVVLQAIYDATGKQIGNTPYAAGVLASSTGYMAAAPNTWVLGGNPVWPSLDFNGDKCMDRLIDSTVYVASCNGMAATTVAAPATALVLLDWDGDGKTDLLANNGGTLGVYRSTGAGFLPMLTTSIPSGSGFFTLDVDGDRLDDLVGVNATGAINYWTHTATGSTPTTFATNIPDLLASVTDGFGVVFTPNYRSTAWGSYERGTPSAVPLIEAWPRIVVSQLTSSDGIGSTFNKTFYYVGARYEFWRNEFLGFQRIDETDSRNGIIARTYYEQTFPLGGKLKQVEVLQPNGTTPISRTIFTNAYATLDATQNNQRQFPYTSGSTTTQYEVEGALNGSLLRTITTATLFDTASGTPYDQTVTTSEPAAGANGVTGGASWTERSFTPLDKLLNDIGNWCIGRPLQTQQINSGSLTYGDVIKRTTDVAWNAALCRPTRVIEESGSSTLQVTTDFGYDTFGNLNSTTVTPVNMSARSSGAIYSDASHLTGQFPLTSTNALGQSSSVTWNYDLGVVTSARDPNDLQTSWQYDAFGRRVRETRADGTYTAFSYSPCSGCDPRVRTYVDADSKDASGVRFARAQQFLDQFDRSVMEYGLRADSNQSITARSFDALGRVTTETLPYTATSSSFASTITYDLAGRPKTFSRPISDNSAALQTSTLYYEGLTTRAIDPQSKQSTTILSAHGEVMRSVDNDGNYQTFDYDSFGNPRRVSDSAGNVLQSSIYNLDGMLTQRTDLEMGTWSFTPDALGEVVAQKDAKNQTTTFEFDKLGRLTKRTEPEGAGTRASTWTWGASSAAKNIGALESVSTPGYAENYYFDSLGRPSSTAIASDTNYTIDYSYNSFSALETLTYPTSTSAYRLKLKYEYQNGYLLQIKDFNSQSTVYWAANTFDPRGQVTQETLGNGLVTRRSFDAVTGLLESIQTGSGGTSGVQNLAYQWDLVGNLKKRTDLNQSNLSESFEYDNLYRLTKSTVSSGASVALAYDPLGNITNKTDVGAYTYDAVRKHQLKSAGSGSGFAYDSNGNMTSGRDGAAITWTSYNYPASITTGSLYSQFSYTPGRNYWKQVSNYTDGPSTTVYVGGLLEKVTRGTSTDYRHMIRVGGATVIVSRQTTGANSVYYVTSDHLGASSAITNASGGVLANLSYDAFGKRRGPNWVGAPGSGDWTAIAATARRGYTDHTMLDNLNMIHMNGRVQDPVLGRFLSADPFISDPSNTQSYNRYSYVLNNPLTFVDPSGFKGGRHDGFPPPVWNCDASAAYCNSLLQSALPCYGYACDWPTAQMGLGYETANAEASRHAGTGEDMNKANGNSPGDWSGICVRPDLVPKPHRRYTFEPKIIEVSGSTYKCGRTGACKILHERPLEEVHPELYVMGGAGGVRSVARSILGGADRAAAKEMQIGYHATRAENVESILANKLKSSTGGRAGSGVYVSESAEGAVAEFAAHNPGVTPTILQVGYSRGSNYFLDGLTRNYMEGPLPLAADTISFQSVRMPGVINTVIRNESAAVLEVLP